MANEVELQSVSKRFGGTTAVDGVSFTIGNGETVALLGPSGCGKTTILRLIAGFETPDSGKLRIGTEDITRRRPYERNVGLLFQHYALFPHMTVAENVAYGLRHRGFPKADIPARVNEMLALVKLPALATRHPGQLSGGQQQRVALARALATRPGVVLLDEPLSALDAKLRQELRTEVKDVLAAVGSTAIVVTHDQEEAMSLGERVFIMSQGRIVQQGTPDDIYDRPANRFVAEFMGRSNWFCGTVIAPDQFRTDEGFLFAIAPHNPDGRRHSLCLRPEHIDVLPDSDAPSENQLAAHVVEVVLLGAARQITIELAGGRRLLALQPNRSAAPPKRGQPVLATFLAAACILVPDTLA
jgi:putative spermidine/putrescine transport system ATP-binding protein/putrescine transport system ATP-binding protein